ncbi:hypothetical protein [Kitasatospora mediocidica]|uniref:hypothetical protein n=1 Tax=Kitasatospora mediocidica TaxID=58352 RepID=UPI000565F09B|nr:hypothetical protein [Kitasatospora mediocidica]
MTERIDLIVGSLRAAELVNAYRTRLREQDHLPDRAALRLACEAYADGCVYVLAAPGQVWERAKPCSLLPSPLTVTALVADSQRGHLAIVGELCGIQHELPLHQLARGYRLSYWPRPEGESDPADDIPASAD